MRHALVAIFIWAALASRAFAVVNSSFVNGDFSLPGGSPGLQAFGVGDPYVTGWQAVNGFNGQTNGAGEYATDRGGMGPCVELGAYATYIGIEQTFTTLVDFPYRVDFLFATDPFNPPTASLRVTAENAVRDYTAGPPTGSGTNIGWLNESLLFTSDSTGVTTLLFQNLAGAAAIDQITVTPVPELGATVFAILPLCALISTRRHRPA